MWPNLPNQLIKSLRKELPSLLADAGESSLRLHQLRCETAAKIGHLVSPHLQRHDQGSQWPWTIITLDPKCAESSSNFPTPAHLLGGHHLAPLEPPLLELPRWKNVVQDGDNLSARLFFWGQGCEDHQVWVSGLRRSRDPQRVEEGHKGEGVHQVLDPLHLCQFPGVCLDVIYQVKVELNSSPGTAVTAPSAFYLALH